MTLSARTRPLRDPVVSAGLITAAAQVAVALLSGRWSRPRRATVAAAVALAGAAASRRLAGPHHVVWDENFANIDLPPAYMPPPGMAPDTHNGPSGGRAGRGPTTSATEGTT